MPLNETSGNLTTDAFGGGVAAVPNYIEDVFSTWLYNGTGGSNTITNDIDLSTKGGLVWMKSRTDVMNSALFDTGRGLKKVLSTDSTSGQQDESGGGGGGLTSWNTNGFTITDGGFNVYYNQIGVTYASWTFRKQPKFFDVVTYTGTGSNTTIAHSLGAVPGSIIVKRTDNTPAAWAVYHRSLANTEYLVLNSTAAKATGVTRWNSTTPTSAVFSVGTDATVNASGGTYVAYLFAHNAGGFGLTGTDNVISCGSASTDATGNWTATLGYEPQWVLWKSTGNGHWEIIDNMRNFSVTDNLRLFANLSSAEVNASGPYLNPTATGFQGVGNAGPANGTIIYIAIRRGPMKVPTTGTSVYKAIAYNGVNTAGQVISGAGFSPDLALTKARNSASGFHFTWMDRLRGTARWVFSDDTAAEGSVAGYGIRSFDMDGVTYGTAYGDYTNIAYTYVAQFLKRAPSFFDEVCYTGTGTSQTISHGLGVVPEILIIKSRSVAATDWVTAVLTVTGALNTTAALVSGGVSQFSSTASTFSVGNSATTNQASGTYVAYLFATCAGVSKCGSYTGTGATQTINCGFGASGSRFVLIKRTDSTGDWYVWDSARGMVSGTDPSLLLNSTAAEVNANSVYAISTGFQIVSTAAGINASGGSYIFLSVA